MQTFTTFEQVHKSGKSEGFLKGRKASVLVPHVNRYCLKVYRKTGTRPTYTLEQTSTGVVVRFA